MKKQLCSMLAVLLILMMGGCTQNGGGTPKVTTTTPVTTTTTAGSAEISKELQTLAEGFVNAIAKSEYDVVKSDYQFDAAMQELIDSGKLEEQIKPTMEQLAGVVEFKTATIVSKEGIDAVVLPTVFTNEKYNMVVSFNENRQIVGFFIQPYAE